MPEPDHTPQHLARRGTAPRARAAVVAGGVVVVLAAGAGAGSLLPEDTGPSSTTAAEQPPARRPGTATPTTAATPTATTPTTAAPSTTAAPPTTTTTSRAAPAAPVPATPAPAPPADEGDGVLELGERGPAVAALQRRLGALGYWLGRPDGAYGQLTRQAVLAFQKVEGLGRDGVAGPATRGRLAVAERPVPRGDDGVEIDLERQVLLVVADGKVRWALNTSTGSGEAYVGSSGGTARADTPPGRFRVQREIDGSRRAPLGTLYRPKYFNGGIAVHGAGTVPATPASHGCARVTNAAMDLLWASGAMAIGAPVTVY